MHVYIIFPLKNIPNIRLVSVQVCTSGIFNSRSSQIVSRMQYEPIKLCQYEEVVGKPKSHFFSHKCLQRHERAIASALLCMFTTHRRQLNNLRLCFLSLECKSETACKHKAMGCFPIIPCFYPWSVDVRQHPNSLKKLYRITATHQ